MERLTAYDADDYAYVKGGKVINKKVAEAILRLAAYEDTGLEPDEIPHWIPVSEPPKAEGWYFVAIKNNGKYRVEQDLYAIELADAHGRKHGFCKAEHRNITHWQPLPAAPKEEK